MTKTFAIEGMMCDHCVKRVTDALNKLEGVTRATVTLKHKKGEAVVEFDREIPDETIVAAVDEAGYIATRK